MEHASLVCRHMRCGMIHKSQQILELTGSLRLKRNLLLNSFFESVPELGQSVASLIAKALPRLSNSGMKLMLSTGQLSFESSNSCLGRAIIVLLSPVATGPSLAAGERRMCAHFFA